MPDLRCFNAYDIRGRLGDTLDEGIAYRIGRAFARVLQARKVVVGYDIRASSPALSEALIQGLMDEGVDVLELGLSGTEEMYCATSFFDADGGVCVTASHNPIDYNGMKMVRAGSAPIGTDTGLSAIKNLAQEDAFGPAKKGASRRDVGGEARVAYVEKVLSIVDISAMKPLSIVVNAGNGAAGPTFDAIAQALDEKGAPLTFQRVHHTPDGSFPNGIPNPLLPENRPVTADAVRAAGADLGIAWDGDFDRCFFFDHRGDFIDGEYIVGLLAAAFLGKEPGATIVHDPRVVWNTQGIVAQGGGVAHQSRTGHAFIKQALRDTGAVYGGEMSAHHYFRDFYCCDSGMIPWLLVVELLGREGMALSDMISARRAAFPSSGEHNFRLEDPEGAITRVIDALEGKALSRDDTDGVSLAFSDWRLNLRRSNTEPLVRLNVESRGDTDLLARKTELVRGLLVGNG